MKPSFVIFFLIWTVSKVCLNDIVQRDLKEEGRVSHETSNQGFSLIEITLDRFQKLVKALLPLTASYFVRLRTLGSTTS